MRLGIIADDFTGATDAGSLIHRRGLSAIVRNGVPCGSASSEADVEIIALKCRTIPVDRACAQVGAALDWLQAAGAAQIYWKYCSTFDSTSEGNIGPVADFLMQRLGCPWTVHCPAFPENGRTVYAGHLFVHGQLLNESPMKDHPLTPMRDSSLIRLLRPQVTSTVGLVPLSGVESGPDQLCRSIERFTATGQAHLIADAIFPEHLETLGTALRHQSLLCGGSAFAAALSAPEENAASARSLPASIPHGPALILSGSCSAATRAQTDAFAKTGGQVVLADPIDIAEHGAARVIDQTLAALGEAPVLLSSTAEPDALRHAQSALGMARASQVLEDTMAEAAKAARSAGATRFVIAGGETSGAVTMGLDIQALRIVHEIAPGVPWCRVSDEVGDYAITLKSGNFGGPDFFAEALALLEEGLA